MGLHTKYPLFLSGFSEFCPQIFEKFPNIKFPENPLLGAELYNVPRGRTDGQIERQKQR
jgi:hypothetical protein